MFHLSVFLILTAMSKAGNTHGNASINVNIMVIVILTLLIEVDKVCIIIEVWHSSVDRQ